MFYLGLGLGILLAVIVGAAVVLIKPQRHGYLKDRCSIKGRYYELTEIPVGVRLKYLERCSKFGPSDGFELMRKDLEISSDLIALHLGRWFIPHRYLMWQMSRLPSKTIAILFRQCVKLSNIPFDIQPIDHDETGSNDEVSEQKPDESADVEPAEDDDFDYPDDGKKPQPTHAHAQA